MILKKVRAGRYERLGYDSLTTSKSLKKVNIDIKPTGTIEVSYDNVLAISAVLPKGFDYTVGKVALGASDRVDIWDNFAVVNRN
jgi:hypothetical protein